MKKKIIGITIDSEQNGDYSDFPYYAARMNYSDMVSKLGAVPIFLAYDIDAIDSYLELIDGLILIGGDVDINPENYGQNIRHESVITNDKRTNFEVKLATIALSKKMPIVAICAGMQLINVIQGGTLYQDINDMVPNSLEHWQTTPRSETWHDIEIEKGSFFHKIIGEKKISVNSHHHQAIDILGKNLIASAKATDGIVEVIEFKNYESFFLGVEYHPEFEVTPFDTKIFFEFIKYVKKNG